MSGDVWRWNADPVWHHHAAMVQEATQAYESKDNFTRFHHLMACFYFGVGTFEAFMNQQMRQKMSSEGDSENKIFTKLRNAKLREKIKEWPAKICNSEAVFPQEYVDIFKKYNELRGEITHPKNTNHDVYTNLEETNALKFSQSISKLIVYIYQERARPFPYWLLGWNYFQIFDGVVCPCPLNNINDFVHSLRNMGFDVPTVEYERAQAWEQKNMTSIHGYEKLLADLESYAEDIEPVRRITGILCPRLTKRWWDEKYILSRTPEMSF